MIKKIIPLAFIIILILSNKSYTQVSPFELSIEPMEITNLGGLQSYSFGQDNGKWLIIGGRLDGLHRRQPWATFDIAGHNNQIIVVDPISRTTWKAPLTSLSKAIQEQLSSTNMQFYQESDFLYCIGGYGYSSSENDHTTYDKLTAINVPEVINAVINNSSFTDYFKQITDSKFQVTGGRLKKINDKFYLLGGQKFLGRYNPMGPDHGPGFIQEYTNSIRIFKINNHSNSINITHLPSFTDNINLHRRDYNAESQILPDGSEGITMFSGVFQEDVDLPFLNCVTIDSNDYIVNNDFQQYYNHYHCPVLPLYSKKDNEMHTIFFGGIAQFYDDNGTLVQDDNVPFVNTIARVTRNSSDIMKEYKLPVEMPSLLSAGGEFIPNKNIPHYNNEVFKLDSILGDSVLIGYIYGGISSSEPNIFFSNTGIQSSASSQIFKVYIKRNKETSIDEFNTSSISKSNLRIYPNPNKSVLNISYSLIKPDDVKISILDLNGKIIERIILKNQSKGENKYSKNMDNLESNVYLIHFETSVEKIVQKLILED